MPGYRLTPDAQSNLVGIRQFTLEQWGVAQSNKYLSELRNTLRLIAENPSLVKARPEVGASVSSFSHASHVIYYIEYGQQMVMFAVLHKRMVPIKHLSTRSKL